MENPLKRMLKKRKAGICCGMPSYCTANALVLEAVLEQAKRFDGAVLIEATSNQVNQYGGYTGMQPADYREFVFSIADRTDFPRENILLGGDHLGPLPWAELPAAEAMERAERLVELFVEAGFQKLHLDTSMRLGDDPAHEPLTDETIAERGVRLYAACERAFQRRRREEPSAERPVFVIGSEVPVPGGGVEKASDGGGRAGNEEIQVTRPEAALRTLQVYEEAFAAAGMPEAMDHIIAIVVQPGVEFNSASVRRYDRRRAEALCRAMREKTGLVMEGHSTDYQPPKALREMVEDGVAILKVGPALTFALREALFALSMMEKELVPEEERADFMEKLEAAMLKDPAKWNRHYRGSREAVRLERRYSFSDRSRYYFAGEELEKAIGKLFANLDRAGIPMSMLDQYMPLQYLKVRDGRLPLTARELAKAQVADVIEDYNYAARYRYLPADIFIE